ncbi:hypothetical protein AVEN_117987-1 [Araneus ventricosus]|uniref:Uncharacterized protein n=1 Tax=Araneus ventricosus TaxID=182803 RepID=A0A4Y2CA26_ARAVE|nr:hypothetical protein AVEN_117987-1 [Araneus ventricosus]
MTANIWHSLTRCLYHIMKSIFLTCFVLELSRSQIHEKDRPTDNQPVEELVHNFMDVCNPGNKTKSQIYSSSLLCCPCSHAQEQTANPLKDLVHNLMDVCNPGNKAKSQI